MKIYVETDRLILRELVPGDENGIFELDSDPEVHRYLGNHPITHIGQARDIIQLVRKQYTDNGIGRWAIIEKNTQSFVGWTGLKLVRERINNHIDYYDLGYRLIKRYWGKGFATETALASLKYGFNELRLTEVYAMADTENTGSNRVLTKAGLNFIECFTYDGAEHNWYRIDREAWTHQKQNPSFAEQFHTP